MKYMFNNPENMITLAREIQSKIYWGERFYLREDEDSIHYDNFWDIAAQELEEGAIGVIIEEDDIAFIH